MMWPRWCWALFIKQPSWFWAWLGGGQPNVSVRWMRLTKLQWVKQTLTNLNKSTASVWRLIRLLAAFSLGCRTNQWELSKERKKVKSQSLNYLMAPLSLTNEGINLCAQIVFNAQRNVCWCSLLSTYHTHLFALLSWHILQEHRSMSFIVILSMWIFYFIYHLVYVVCI